MVNQKIPSIKDIYFGNELICDENIIAEKFNDYFIDSIEKIVNDKGETEDDTLERSGIERPLTILNKFKHIKVKDIERIVNDLKKVNSVDGIDKNVIKAGFTVISRELVEIINTSIDNPQIQSL